MIDKRHAVRRRLDVLELLVHARRLRREREQRADKAEHFLDVEVGEELVVLRGMLPDVLELRAGRETLEIRGGLACIAGDRVTHRILAECKHRQGIEKRVAHGKAGLCFPDGILHAEVIPFLEVAMGVRLFERALKPVETRRGFDAFVADVHAENKPHVERDDGHVSDGEKHFPLHSVEDKIADAFGVAGGASEGGSFTQDGERFFEERLHFGFLLEGIELGLGEVSA